MDWSWVWRWPRWFFLIILIGVFVLLFGIAIHFIEPSTFPTVAEGAWWVLITISTVGYGDYAPTTAAGRWMAAFILLFGAGVISSFFFTIASTAFTRHQKFYEGKQDYKGSGHVVIIGWNARTSWLLDQDDGFSYVLVDESIEYHPRFESDFCQFIKGKAIHPSTLQRASVDRASAVIITANQHLDEETADAQTILTLLTVRGLHPTIPCIVELLTHEQIASAKKAGATSIIESHYTVGNALHQSLITYS
ncbi:hypothetical protein KP78_37970 [Jeotgalibacillus soli]|uniref:RCK N-terminal domain-containing protein n=2 Tax=Jeotgalibacillus soli TaxID=889306 RepID=A0A0C2RLG4_9BACL|nr:hypothetical protein KP78_37970 [Jeotgalibacillus soli]